MRASRIFTKTLAVLAQLFGVTVAAMAALSAWLVDRNQTEAFQRQGTAIATGLASSSVELLQYRDASTIQAAIDQYLDIPGVAYVFVVDSHKEIISHTFAPGIPEELRNLPGDSHGTASRWLHL